MQQCNSITLFFFCLLLAYLAGCSKQEKTATPISREKFIEIYARMLIIGEETKSNSQGGKEKIQNLLKQHEVTEETLKTTVAAFNKHPEEWKEIYKEVIQRLERMRDERAQEQK
jgi:hypothetical protein